MKWFDFKYAETEDAKVTHLLVGRLPYGPNGFYVKASAKLGDSVLWTHLMSVGGTFSGTDYIVVKAKSEEELANKVTAESEDRCLHGTPFEQNDVWHQVLVAWDLTTSKARRRQLFGSLLTLKYTDYDETDVEVKGEVKGEGEGEGKGEDEGEGEGEGEVKGEGEGEDEDEGEGEGEGEGEVKGEGKGEGKDEDLT